MENIKLRKRAQPEPHLSYMLRLSAKSVSLQSYSRWENICSQPAHSSQAEKFGKIWDFCFRLNQHTDHTYLLRTSCFYRATRRIFQEIRIKLKLSKVIIVGGIDEGYLEAREKKNIIIEKIFPRTEI